MLQRELNIRKLKAKKMATPVYDDTGKRDKTFDKLDSIVILLGCVMLLTLIILRG